MTDGFLEKKKNVVMHGTKAMVVRQKGVIWLIYRFFAWSSISFLELQTLERKYLGWFSALQITLESTDRWSNYENYEISWKWNILNGRFGYIGRPFKKTL